MSNNNDNMNGKDFVIGALVGGIIGAGVALLLAPKSGKELRHELSDGYHNASRKTQEVAKNVGEQTEAIVGRVKEVAETVKEDVNHWRANAKEKAVQAKEEVKDQVENTVEKVKEEAAAALDKAEHLEEDMAAEARKKIKEINENLDAMTNSEAKN